MRTLHLLTVGATLLAASVSQASLSGWPFGSDKSCDLSLNWEMPGTAAELMAKAQARMEEKSYCEAAQIYLEIGRQHPAAPEHFDAEFFLIDALFLGGYYDDSITAAKEYNFLHPANPRSQHAHFRIAEAFFARIPGIEFDQEMTIKAQMAFSGFLKKYPDSARASEAREKMIFCYNRLAEAELHVGKYYFERGDHRAAALRFETVPKRFRNSVHVPEALYRLALCLIELKKPQDAARVVAAMERHFPDSPYTRLARSLPLAERKEL